MTVLHNTHSPSLFNVVSSLISARVQEAAEHHKARAKANQARNELLRYTDRELADIGLTRSQVLEMDFTQNG